MHSADGSCEHWCARGSPRTPPHRRWHPLRGASGGLPRDGERLRRLLRESREEEEALALSADAVRRRGPPGRPGGRRGGRHRGRTSMVIAFAALEVVQYLAEGKFNSSSYGRLAILSSHLRPRCVAIPRRSWTAASARRACLHRRGPQAQDGSCEHWCARIPRFHRVQEPLHSHVQFRKPDQRPQSWSPRPFESCTHHASFFVFWRRGRMRRGP